MLTSGGKRVSWDVAADATTNNNPPITSTFGFYVTLTTELADDISLRHTVLTFNSSSSLLTLALTLTLYDSGCLDGLLDGHLLA